MKRVFYGRFKNIALFIDQDKDTVYVINECGKTPYEYIYVYVYKIDNEYLIRVLNEIMETEFEMRVDSYRVWRAGTSRVFTITTKVDMKKSLE